LTVEEVSLSNVSIGAVPGVSASELNAAMISATGTE
jgi:hypothetical protein